MMNAVILIHDPFGAIYDGNPTYLNYRVIIEDNQFYGVENLRSRFDSDRDWLTFLKMLSEIPEGTFNDITWRREK